MFFLNIFIQPYTVELKRHTRFNVSLSKRGCEDVWYMLKKVISMQVSVVIIKPYKFPLQRSWGTFLSQQYYRQENERLLSIPRTSNQPCFLYTVILLTTNPRWRYCFSIFRMLTRTRVFSSFSFISFHPRSSMSSDTNFFTHDQITFVIV